MAGKLMAGGMYIFKRWRASQPVIPRGGSAIASGDQYMAFGCFPFFDGDVDMRRTKSEADGGRTLPFICSIFLNRVGGEEMGGEGEE
jgi:hypothetical protein